MEKNKTDKDENKELKNSLNENQKMELGIIVNTFGLKGELKIYPYVDYILKVKKVYINNNLMEIERARIQKNIYVIKLKGIDTIEEAEKLKNSTLLMDRKDAPDLPKGTYYVSDLIGFDVYTDEGKLLGKLDDVFQTGANDVYQVGKILIPVINDVVKQIDTENKKIIVHLLKGLI